jgi:hypothetical protein
MAAHRAARHLRGAARGRVGTEPAVLSVEGHPRHRREARREARRARRATAPIRAIPFVGAVVSVFFIVRKIRDEGVVRGGADAALDMTPGVGRAKAVYETLDGEILPAEDEGR